jgi:small conductance mechanosensitive channel
MDSTFETFKQYLTSPDKLASLLLGFGVKVLGAVIVLVIGILLIKLILSVLQTTMRRTVRDTTVRQYAAGTARILLWAILLVILLGIFGLETAQFVTIIGAAGLAIGLALQGSLSNFAAGFMLLLFRPFKAGDEVEVATVTGTVIEIGIFSTIIDLQDNVRAFVPNGTIFSGVIKNRSMNEYLRVEMKVMVAPETDITRAQQVIQRMLASNDLILEVPRPDVQVVEGESTGITIAVRPYSKLRNAEAVRTTVNKEIREELRRAGIEVLKH